MTQKGRMMIVQDICGAGADYLVPRRDAAHSHTMIQVDRRAGELRKFYENLEIDLSGTTEQHLVKSVNEALKTCEGHWEVDDSIPPMTPGSCFDRVTGTWKPCGEVTPEGKITTGRVLVLRRKPDVTSQPEEIQVRSELDTPAPLRVFTTRYCAFVQYAE